MTLLLLLLAAQAPLDPDEPPHALSPLVQDCLAIAHDDVDAGRECLRSLLDAGELEGADRADAEEAERVLLRLRRHAPSIVQPQQEQKKEDLTTTFVLGGGLEATMNGAAWGATAGFLASAGVLSFSRTSEKDAFPWLLAAPAIGLVAGGAGAGASAYFSGASADDVAFISSTTWAATASAFTLQLAVFADSRDVQAAPLRFFSTLTGGALGLAAGIGWAPFLDVTAGDVSLANSAFVWGGTLALTGIFLNASFNGDLPDFPTGTMIVGAGALIPWGALMALHPFLKLHRVSTWLVDVGGVVGLVGGACVGGLAMLTLGDGRAFLPIFGAGIAGGLAFGVVGAYVVDEAAREAVAGSALASSSPVIFAPTVFAAKDGLAPGVVVAATW